MQTLRGICNSTSCVLNYLRPLRTPPLIFSAFDKQHLLYQRRFFFATLKLLRTPSKTGGFRYTTKKSHTAFPQLGRCTHSTLKQSFKHQLSTRQSLLLSVQTIYHKTYCLSMLVYENINKIYL